MAQPSLSALLEQDLSWLRLVWCDNGNLIRGKAVHLPGRRDLPLAVGLSAAQQGVPATADAVAPGSGLTPVGETWLVPDWETLRPLPYAPGHSRVIGDMVGDLEQRDPWPWCGRQFLRRMVQRAADMGWTVQAAFEPEFYLVQREGTAIAPVDQTPFATTLAMDQHQSVIDAIARALTAQGLTVEQYYPESGPGQQEISVRHTHALAAADQHLIYRDTVKAVAAHHGLVASFVPKLFEGAAGSGCHLHLSLWEGDRNCIPNDEGEGLSPLAQQFAAGVLTHLSALMALSAPSPNSYRRIVPHSWSGAFCAWGPNNREAALRVPSNPTRPRPTHLELKPVDGAANPYLALGAVIAAGLDGIQRRLTLPAPTMEDPGNLSMAQRRERGITPLPGDLATALTALETDSVLTQALGSPLTQAHLAVRRAELTALAGLSLAEEAALLLDRY